MTCEIPWNTYVYYIHKYYCFCRCIADDKYGKLSNTGFDFEQSTTRSFNFSYLNSLPSYTDDIGVCVSSRCAFATQMLNLQGHTILREGVSGERIKPLHLLCAVGFITAQKKKKLRLYYVCTCITHNCPRVSLI